ncbi:hypothetical protein D3C78_1761420 [compost metagenome]
MGAGYLGLGLGGYGADHVQPKQPRPLRDNQAHPASSRMQKHAVTGFEVIQPA